MRHHYVPQFLLSGWKGADHRAGVFDLAQPSIAYDRTGPRHTGYEEDLWALTREQVAGMSQQVLEQRFFNRIDGDASRVRLKLLDGAEISASERSAWTRFLMSLRLRQPSIVRELIASSAETLRQTLRQDTEIAEVLAEHGETESVEDWTERNYPGLIENFGLSFFAKMGLDQNMQIKINSMSWCVIGFTAVNFELLLSDNPCIITPSILNHNCIIAVPISPKKAFFATKGTATHALRRQNLRDLARLLNESSVMNASRRIYSTNANQRRFIENRHAAWKQVRQVA